MHSKPGVKLPYGRIATLFLALATVFIANTAITSRAAAGDLDLTFDGDGKRLDTIPGGGHDGGRSVLIQSDGKIVTIGNSSYGYASICSATRHFTDGTLDASFGSGGKVFLEPALSISCTSAALQNDGKIVAAGYSLGGPHTDFALIRLDTTGSLDTTFSGDGIVTTPIGGYHDHAFAVAVQQDGKIVAAGTSYNQSQALSDFALARYNTNGSLDTTFGGDGIVTTPIGDISEVRAVAVQPDGRIVAAGTSSYFCDPKNGCSISVGAVSRYNSDGSLDTTFDSDGKVTTPIGPGADATEAVAIQSDGRIVTAGHSWNGSNFAFALVRYNTNGSLDTTFDSDGIVTTAVGSVDDRAVAVAVQPDGKIVAAGAAYEPPDDTDFAVVRYNADGSHDTTFDGDGIVITPVGTGYDGVHAVAIQPDGKMVAMGTGINGLMGSDFALVRYNADGSLDAAGFNGGIVLTDIGDRGMSGRAVAVQPDGKIVAAGLGMNGVDSALFRFNADGSLDTTFDGDGRAIIPIGMGFGGANTVAIQSDGKIVAAGLSDNGSYDFALIRYNTDGTLDTTFGGDGVVTTAIGAESSDVANALAIQPDGKIIAAGSTVGGVDPNVNDFAIVRYNKNGSLDTTFGGDGIVTTDITTDKANAVAIQPDGKIVAAGYSYNDGFKEFALVRYNPGGSLDTTFDGDGIVTTTQFQPVGRSDYYANAIAIQPDTKIVVAGTSQYQTSKFAIFRYNPDGSRDQTFNNGGIVTTAVGSGHDGADSVSIQPDGKLVAAGTSSNYDGFGADFALVRYDPDGSLDVTFGGGDGKVTADFNHSHDYAGEMALDGEGRAVVVGESYGALAIARFLLAPPPPLFDFDGDGRADISVFRPSDRTWYLNRSTDGFSAIQFGLLTDKIAPADYDGDGKTDISVYRDGVWYWLKSSDTSFNARQFGIASDIPVPADFTGDGRSELAIFRSGVWWSLDLTNNQTTAVQLGFAADKPVVADYDGDGRADQAVYRSGEWHINRSTLGQTSAQFGLPSDRPVAADYDGDGKADVAVYRDGTWYLQRSIAGFKAFQFGVTTDTPVPADYDGDGKTDAAVFRNGVWYLQQSTSGFAARQFGLPNDKPIAAAFIP